MPKRVVAECLLNGPLTNSISDFLLIVCIRRRCQQPRTTGYVVGRGGQGPAYLDILIVFFINHVDGLLDVSENEIAVAVVGLVLR
jgi:hypothetical protein